MGRRPNKSNNDLKNTVMERDDKEEQGSNVEKRGSVRLQVHTMTKLHHPEGAPSGV